MHTFGRLRPDQVIIQVQGIRRSGVNYYRPGPARRVEQDRFPGYNDALKGLAYPTND